MPSLEILPMSLAQEMTSRGARSQPHQEYAGFILGVGPGQAGCLVAGPNETTQAVRRRLTIASKEWGVAITVKRRGEEVYFWRAEPSKRRGRPRKA